MENVTKSEVLLNKLVTSRTNEWSRLAIDEIYDQFGDKVTIKPKTLIQFGRNPDVDISSSPETVWTVGELSVANETYLATNTIDRIVSTSAADTVILTIEGHTLAAGVFTFVTQSVTLNGQTDVSLTTPLARCSKVFNNSGTNLVGLISIFDTTGTSTSGVVSPDTALHIQIPAGKQQTLKCATTLSNTDYGIITQLIGGQSSKTGAALDFELQVKLVDKVWRTVYTFGGTLGTTSIILNPYIIIPKNSDIRIAVTTDTVNTDVFASMHLLLATTLP